MSEDKNKNLSEKKAIELRDKMNSYNGKEMDAKFILYFKEMYDDPITGGQMLLDGEFRGVFKSKLGVKRIAILKKIIAQFPKQKI